MKLCDRLAQFCSPSCAISSKTARQLCNCAILNTCLPPGAGEACPTDLGITVLDAEEVRQRHVQESISHMTNTEEELLSKTDLIGSKR